VVSPSAARFVWSKRRDAGTAAREIPVLPKFRQFLMDEEALQIVAERLKAKDSIRGFGKLFQNLFKMQLIDPSPSRTCL
jgi:hypothetical protein